MYLQLAHLYDWPGTLDFSRKMLERLLPILDMESLHPPARILDLACGTGTLSISLAQHGYQITGLDLSEAMLSQARLKQASTDPEKRLKLAFLQADMRYFQAESPMDAVLCFYDSLNHLSNETELRAAFLQVAQALKPGGLFLFDLNTLENYQTFWSGSDTDEGPNYRLRTTSRFDADSGKAEVVFVADEYTDSGTLITRSEVLQEQYFNETAVEKYLMAADFVKIRREFFNPVEDLPAAFPLKTFWQCQRT